VTAIVDGKMDMTYGHFIDSDGTVIDLTNAGSDLTLTAINIYNSSVMIDGYRVVTFPNTSLKSW
jgi:hypothetical protein